MARNDSNVTGKERSTQMFGWTLLQHCWHLVFLNTILPVIFAASESRNSIHSTHVDVFDTKWDGHSRMILKHWHFLGPFPCGKNELDGNPVESIGRRGILDAIRDKDLQIYSELAEGGMIGWSEFKNVQSGRVLLSQNSWGPKVKVNWNNLYRTLDPLALEWQGSLVTAFNIQNPSGALILIDCSGATHAEIFGPPSFEEETNIVSSVTFNVTNDVSLPSKLNTYFSQNNKFFVNADVYGGRTQDAQSAIELRAGWHLLHIRVRAKLQASVQCRLQDISNLRWRPDGLIKIRMLPFVPDLVDGAFIGAQTNDPTNALQATSAALMPVHVFNPSSSTVNCYHFALNFLPDSKASLLARKMGISVDLVEQPASPSSTRHTAILHPHQSLIQPLSVTIKINPRAQHHSIDVIQEIASKRQIMMQFCDSLDNRIQMQLTMNLCSSDVVHQSRNNGHRAASYNHNKTFSTFQNETQYIQLMNPSIQGSIFQFECRKSNQSFIFTFPSTDGSIQHAAAIRPRYVGNVDTPVALFLGGTGVGARSAADAHKWKPNLNDAEYTFGVNGMWLLCPERHGAHNWEGLGMKTAIAALNSLRQWSKWTYFIPWEQENLTNTLTPLEMLLELRKYPANDQDISISGHSMGGHGAWILSTHLFRERLLGLAVLAGWIQKEYYADSNRLWDRDEATVYGVPLMLRLILEATLLGNSIPQHIPALTAHVLGPLLIRVGGDDAVVSPWFSRRLARLLTSLTSASGWESNRFIYDEVPQKEHWWWDSQRDNDGGVVFDDTMRRFYDNVLQKQALNQIKGSSNQTFKLPRNNPSYLVTGEPGSSTMGRCGIRIEFRRFPLEVGSIHSTMESRSLGNNFGAKVGTTLSIVTKNVQRVSINLTQLQTCLINSTQSFRLKIDGKEIGQSISVLDRKKVVVLHFCQNLKLNYSGIQWEHCKAGFRQARDAGPARQIIESQTVHIVVPVASAKGALPTPNKEKTNMQTDQTLDHAYLYQGAIWLSRQLLTMGYIDAKIVLDNDEILLSCLRNSVVQNNFIFLGDASQNAAVKFLQDRSQTDTSQRPEQPEHVFNETCDVLPDHLTQNEQNTLSSSSSRKLRERFLFPLHFEHGDTDKNSSWTCIVGTDKAAKFAGKNMGVLSVIPLPQPDSTSCVGLVIAAGSASSFWSVMMLGLPTVPPMARAPFTNLIPDWVIVDSDNIRARGEGQGGFAAAGFYDEGWSTHKKASYFALDLHEV